MDSGNTEVVLVRMDKIGDLAVSLPVDEHPGLRGRGVHWFITKGLGFITDQAVPKRRVSEFKRGFSPFEFRRMVSTLRVLRPQTIVLLHCPWWVSMAAKWAGVPERVGRKSQWHSFLFLNLGLRQKRSRSDRHESDFNFDLVEWGLNKLGLRPSSNLARAKDTYLRMLAPNPFGTISARGLNSRGYRIVHPGMAGSALNWPQDLYRELILQLANEMPVLITGTKMDQKYLESLTDLKGQKNIRWMVDEIKVNELLDLLAEARSVIAPSTGVVHLAAALGTPTVGIYSPRRVEHPRRWGARGPRVRLLVPPVQDAESFQPEIMRQITVAQVLETVRELESGNVPSHANP